MELKKQFTFNLSEDDVLEVLGVPILSHFGMPQLDGLPMVDRYDVAEFYENYGTPDNPTPLYQAEEPVSEALIDYVRENYDGVLEGKASVYYIDHSPYSTYTTGSSILPQVVFAS